MAGLHVRKGDQVAVIAGKEKGKTGKVLKTLPAKQRVIVEGLHLIKRAAKPTQKNPQGGFITKEGSVHASNLMLICPSCDQPRRVGHRQTDDGNSVRVCRSCGTEIGKG